MNVAGFVGPVIPRRLQSVLVCQQAALSCQGGFVVKYGMSISTVQTKPFEGQKPGTSGLRKKVKVLHSFLALFSPLMQQGL